MPSKSTELSPLGLGGGWRLWRLAALRTAGFSFDLLDKLAIPPAHTTPAPEIGAATSAAIAELLCDDTFRAALTWQNPDLLHNWVQAYVDAIGNGDDPPLPERLRREAVIARYAQRYCAKNDTIGFFGPVAWATLGEPDTGHTGTGAIRRAQVHFEVWAVQAVADAWNSDPELAPHLPVRLDPACTDAGGEVRRPTRAPLRLTATDRKLLDALPSARSVGGLIAGSGLAGDDGRDAVARLRTERVLQVGFLAPLDSAPESHLARQVAAIPDENVRERLNAVLRGLKQAAGQVATAGDPKRLLAALDAAGRELERAAGVPARWRPGLAAGGRTPLYLDCRRDLDATVGADLVAALDEPLSVLLDSARWLAGQVGEVVDEALRDRYRSLSALRDTVTLADLQLAAADVLAPGGELLAEVLDDFQQRWSDILPAGDDDAVVPPGPARRLADALFPATGRWWAAARVHSPDLMLRRAADGQLSWVLGELHVALNTLENRFFGDQADDRDAILATVAADIAPGRVVPVYPNTSAEVSPRTYPPLSLDPPGHYRYWSYGSDAGHHTGVSATAATTLVVRERDGDLVASGDGWEAPVLECFGEFVTALVVNLFRLRPAHRYAPRVSIGNLTVCRRTWRLPLAELGAVPVRSADAAHDRLRRWADAQGIPRHVFVRTPVHPKPFYVDFAAPVLVDNLARAARRAVRAGADPAWVELVEMLPGPDELWLTLPDGRRYTSELRVVAVDPVAHDRASWPAPGEPATGQIDA